MKQQQGTNNEHVGTDGQRQAAQFARETAE
jgi:hypothetical protein